MFNDEFDGAVVDINKWKFEDWGNSYYSAQASLDYIKPDGSNLQLSNGTLKIIAKKETIDARVIPYCPDPCYPNNCTPQEIDDCILTEDLLPNKRTFYYTSGALYSNTQQLGLFGPGKYEIRCKIPKIDGLWPSFWLFGECSQEIDIFEFSNTDENNQWIDPAIGSSRVRKSYHKQPDCNTYPPKCASTEGENTPVDAIDYSQDFHVFTVVWDAYQITWYVDGIARRKIYGILNSLGQAVDECNISLTGGPYLWNDLMPTFPMDIRIGMSVIDFCDVKGVLSAESCASGTYPATYEIDYVRAWKRVPVNNNIYTCTPLRPSDVIINDNHIHGTHTLHIENTITNDEDVVIENDADIWWTAGEYIELTPGLTVEYGAEFIAEIADCEHGFVREMANSNNSNSNPASEPLNEKLFVKKDILISPNPSNGSVQIISQEDNISFSKVEVHNYLGEIVYSNAMDLTDKFNLNFPSTAKGLFFVKLFAGDKIYTEKVIVQ